MWKATTGMWKLNFGFQQPSILSGICKYRLYSKAVWISNSSIVPAALNHGLTNFEKPFYRNPTQGPCACGRSSGTDEPSGYFGNQAVFGPLLLSTTQLGRSCKSGNELEKVCRSAGRTFKPFLYGAMHDGNDYKNRSIRLQQFSPKTTCW